MTGFGRTETVDCNSLADSLGQCGPTRSGFPGTPPSRCVITGFSLLLDPSYEPLHRRIDVAADGVKDRQSLGRSVSFASTRLIGLRDGVCATAGFML
jgi:hypothetical protein